MLRDIRVGPQARLAGTMEQTGMLRPLAGARHLSFSSLKGNLGQTAQFRAAGIDTKSAQCRCYPCVALRICDP